jgi:hypothetical protein
MRVAIIQYMKKKRVQKSTVVRCYKLDVSWQVRAVACIFLHFLKAMSERKVLSHDIIVNYFHTF